ncbi:hypothetical protein BA190_03850 [Labrys sp. WJW]|uniref:hypothetical protein n=1 Tax=Labrys sp. WJW TaxID=1737983 RepID=UPI000836C2BF|nr:hypothetical protein [Labrys sp. WJW]OCC06373.1 hypothetical protein BA190_03850 [Labrys sp. WJW]
MTVTNETREQLLAAFQEDFEFLDRLAEREDSRGKSEDLLNLRERVYSEIGRKLQNLLTGSECSDLKIKTKLASGR